MAHIRDFVNCFIFMLQKAIRRARARRPRQATVLIIKRLRSHRTGTRVHAPVPISVVPQSAPSTVGARSGLGFGSSATIGCLPERTTLRAAGATPRPSRLVLSSPERRRAGETNIPCMQLSCMHPMNIQKHTVLSKSGKARSMMCDVSHTCDVAPQARRAFRSWSAAPPRLSCLV